MKKNNTRNNGLIVGKDTFVECDIRNTSNVNMLVAGGSGSGKTRGIVIPQVLHSSEDMNLIITDTKGNLHLTVGEKLRQKGYKVMRLDFKNIGNSPFGYNPMSDAYIEKCFDEKLNERGDFYSEQSVKKLARVLCPIQEENDIFWDMESARYLECYMLYALNCLPVEQHNLYEVSKLISLDKFEKDDDDNIFVEECELHEDSAFARKYRSIRKIGRAEKYDASVRGILTQHLDVVSFNETERLFTMEPQIDLSEFLKGKTALFINVSDVDRSQDPLVSLFYTQALQYLLKAADERPDSRLPIHTRFIFDDFSSFSSTVPDFDNIMSVIRSRNISATIIVQSVSQLNARYKRENAQTIINNCDSMVYLGSSDPETARYFAEKANCLPSAMLDLPDSKAYLFRRGSKPTVIDKYKLEDDAVYSTLVKRAASAARSGEKQVK